MTPATLFLIAAHVAGFLTMGVVLLRGRTPQGTVAWLLALLLIPWVAVPAYWLFGRPFFHGYVLLRRRNPSDMRASVSRFPITGITGFPETQGNLVQILKGGDATFASLFDGFARAQESIAVQFYIIRDDPLGRAFRDALLAAAGRGVRIYLLMDWVGSQRLPRRWDRDFRAAGIEVQRFRSSWGRIFRFQLKFRNHRKITVVDGMEGWLGGLNMGEEYRGRGRDRRPWRDTHACIQGPAVRDLQILFSEDWFWAAGVRPHGLRWPEIDAPGAAEREGTAVTIVPSHPSDGLPVGRLLFLDVMQSARERLWITTAYFVPDPTLTSALQLAALRGVDVRILVPARGDLRYMDSVSFAFFEPLLLAGVKIFRYQNGVLHAKTAVVDDELGLVGTANMDPRSLELNFEVTALLRSVSANRVLADHMEADLNLSTPLTLADLSARPLRDRILTRIFYLFSPAL
jgi:cardiolipin synthase A/B